MRFTVQYIPLSKIKPDFPSNLTSHIRKASFDDVGLHASVGGAQKPQGRQLYDLAWE